MNRLLAESLFRLEDSDEKIDEDLADFEEEEEFSDRDDAADVQDDSGLGMREDDLKNTEDLSDYMFTKIIGKPLTIPEAHLGVIPEEDSAEAEADFEGLSKKVKIGTPEQERKIATVAVLKPTASQNDSQFSAGSNKSGVKKSRYEPNISHESSSDRLSALDELLLADEISGQYEIHLAEKQPKISQSKNLENSAIGKAAVKWVEK